MKFSIAVKDITPEFPVFQAGFGSRTHKSESVLQSIFMKAVLLQANKALLMVAFDAMGGDRSFVDGMKDALHQRFGLKHEEVLFNFSHAHSSVYLTGLDAVKRQGVWSIGQDGCPARHFEGAFDADEDYFRFLRSELLQLVEGCYRDLAEGELSLATVSSHFAISRRLLLPEGCIDFAPSEKADIDRELSVFKLSNVGGIVKGVIYSIGAHPTALGECYLLANDFVGYSSTEIEKSCPGAVAVFLQGCGAELKPRATVAGDSFTCGSIKEVQAMGEDLAGQVLDILQQAEFRTIRAHFNTALHNCILPTTPDPIEFYRSILERSEPGGFLYNSATAMLAARLEGSAKATLPCYISVWRLDADTHLVAIEGEVSTEYSLALKRYFAATTLVVLGYSNGVTAYIPTRKMIREGGYEAECNYFFGLQGRYIPEIEDIIIGQAARLLYEAS